MTAKPKALIQKENRQRKKDAGLVQFRAWVTVDNKQKLQELFDSFESKITDLDPEFSKAIDDNILDLI